GPVLGLPTRPGPQRPAARGGGVEGRPTPIAPAPPVGGHRRRGRRQVRRLAAAGRRESTGRGGAADRRGDPRPGGQVAGAQGQGGRDGGSFDLLAAPAEPGQLGPRVHGGPVMRYLWKRVPIILGLAVIAAFGIA